jgi:pyruvate dehydrogenase E2 component (dihydrolipoamide acetyltransferase)
MNQSCKTSPRARRALRRLALDPVQIKGSGPNGRIVEADVLRASSTTAISPVPPNANRRHAIAARTLANFTGVPHFYLRAEADATRLMAERARLVASIEKLSQVRVTVTDFLLAAQARALAACPWANAVWLRDDVRHFSSVDIGLVVALDDGLLIPVMHDVDRLTVVDLARERSQLLENIHHGRLAASQFEGGASSLSNLGRSRTDEFAAIINQPQSTMLAAGRIASRPWVVDGKLTVAQTIHLTLSVDHRVLDGEPASRFFDQIVHFIENPPVVLSSNATT